MKASIEPLPLVLGTAQLGMNYGIANKEGKPSLDRAVEIVAGAWESGIRFFDTARAYGDSEKVLGHCFREILDRGNHSELAVISKLSPNIDLSNADGVLKEVEDSLKNLGVDCLWGLTLHRESTLDQCDKSFETVVARLKNEKKVLHFGVSTYSPEKTAQALRMGAMDVVQFPFSVLDQRPLEHGLFRLAEERGKKVFVRSLFLQGLLLMDPENLPEKMLFAKRILKEYVEFSDECNLSPRLLAMAFAVQKALLARIVIGCESTEQVRENVDLFHRAKTIDLPDLTFLSQKEPKIINPAMWPQ